MNQEKVRRFLKTKPSIEQIVGFVEAEAQKRFKELKEQEEKEKQSQHKVICKRIMAEMGDDVRRWAKEDDNTFPFLKTTFRECIKAGEINV